MPPATSMKTRIISSAVPFSSPATLAFRVENPPVARVAKVWVMESNNDRPATSNRTICRAVNPRYMVQSRRAVSAILGVIRSGEGPGTSARSRFIPPAPRRGRMATKRAMIPMPPSQWEKLRQKSIPRGKASTSANIVAPVVVKPDMDSKNASTGAEVAPVSRKGIAPSRAADSQPRDTTAKPSFMVTDVGVVPILRMSSPSATETAPENKKDAASGSPWVTDHRKGSTWATPRKMTRVPRK